MLAAGLHSVHSPFLLISNPSFQLKKATHVFFQKETSDRLYKSSLTLQAPLYPWVRALTTVSPSDPHLPVLGLHFFPLQPRLPFIHPCSCVPGNGTSAQSFQQAKA